MEFRSLQKKKKKTPIIFEEETQETSMANFISTTRGSDSNYFKIPSFLLKTFRKRFDYIHERENSSQIDKKKKWLIGVASTLYKFFGGVKFSPRRIRSKIHGKDQEDEDSSSESEAESEDYHNEWGNGKFFATDESSDGSETENRFRRDEKISSQSRVRISFLDIFSKKNNAIDYNYNYNFNFNFNFKFSFDSIKRRICKGKIGNRNNRNLDYEQNLKQLLRIPSRERKQIRGNSSTAISYECDHKDDENGEQLWRKRILMGEKCKPLMNTSASVSLQCDQYGMLWP